MKLRQRLANFIQGYQAGPPAHDDFWYQNFGQGIASFAGVTVSADRAMRLAAVQACVRLIANAVAMLPLNIIRRLPGDTTEIDREHPIHDLLHDEPNPIQTAFEFRQCMTGNLVLRGNAYAEIRPGRRGFADTLWPLHPDYVKVRLVKETGRLEYTFKPPNKPDLERVFDMEKILHLRDLSSDGLVGVSRIAQASDGIGSAIATDIYAATYWGNGSAPGGVLSSDGALTTDQAKTNRDQWEEAHRGAANSNRVAVLGGGMKYTATAPNNKESQFLDTRSYQIGDIARLFGVPAHMIGHTVPSTSFGSGLEQMSQGFVTYTLGSWLTIWESAIRRDLIIDTRRWFAEHNTKALVKSDIQTRTEAYRIALGRAGEDGWMTPEEVRRAENMNPEPKHGTLRKATDGAAMSEPTPATPTNGTNGTNGVTKAGEIEATA